MQKHTTIISSDEPVRVEVHTDGRWFRLFSSLVESGTWARLSDSACRVYVALAKHCDQRWIAWPSLRTLGRMAGSSPASVKRALIELHGEGLLNRRRGGGRLSTVYELLEAAATPSLPFPAAPVRDLSAGSPQSHQQAHARAISRPTREPRTKPVNKTTETTADAAAISELIGKGVESDVASELVRRFGAAAAKLAVKKAERQAGRLRNKAGFIRSAIERGFAGEAPRPSIDQAAAGLKQFAKIEAEASARAAAAFYASKSGQRSTG